MCSHKGRVHTEIKKTIPYPTCAFGLLRLSLCSSSPFRLPASASYFSASSSGAHSLHSQSSSSADARHGDLAGSADGRRGDFLGSGGGDLVDPENGWGDVASCTAMSTLRVARPIGVLTCTPGRCGNHKRGGDGARPAGG